MMAIATAATVFWLSITPQIGIDNGTPGNNMLSYGGTAVVNLGPVSIRLHGSITPFEEPEDEPNSWIENTRIKHSNIGASVWYPVLYQPITFRLGVNYHMSRVNYYNFEGTPTLGYNGEDYLRHDHSFLAAGLIEMGNLFDGKGPFLSIWSGYGPAYVTSEGREWRWPSDPDAPVGVTSLIGSAITIDGGFGIAAIQNIIPHFAITGTADFR
ncbi:MAG: hypothetical protein GY771_07380, partial [bacterium]|nr:hypothetical protein [bacterium]